MKFKAGDRVRIFQNKGFNTNEAIRNGILFLEQDYEIHSGEDSIFGIGYRLKTRIGTTWWVEECDLKSVVKRIRLPDFL